MMDNAKQKREKNLREKKLELNIRKTNMWGSERTEPLKEAMRRSSSERCDC